MRTLHVRRVGPLRFPGCEERASVLERSHGWTPPRSWLYMGNTSCTAPFEETSHP
jgi:hypothetical protein